MAQSMVQMMEVITYNEACFMRFLGIPPAPPGFLDRLKFWTDKEPSGKPRKIPVKVEPKVFFANERTFLAWLNMAVTLSSIAIAILA